MRKFAGRPQKVNTDVIGLDVHKDVTVFSHLDSSGTELHCGRLPSKWEEVWNVVAELSQGREVHVAMEASGGMLWLYDRFVEKLGEEHVHVAQPRRIRAIANSQSKNDENDAFWLAYYTYEGRLPEAWIPTGQMRELRLAVRARREAVRAQTRSTVHIKSYLRQMGEGLPGRCMSGKAVQERLEELAATTPGVLGQALRITLARYKAAVSDVKAWEQTIDELVGSMPEVKAVTQNIPGVGRVLAAVIVGESGPITRFETSKAYARYTGLTPADLSTGGRTIHGGMTREGSSHLRWALGQAVMACLRCKREPGSGPEGAVARWVDAKERRMGNRAKARVAAAHKLATSIWWLFHHPERFSAWGPFGARPAKIA